MREMRGIRGIKRNKGKLRGKGESEKSRESREAEKSGESGDSEETGENGGKRPKRVLDKIVNQGIQEKRTTRSLPG